MVPAERFETLTCRLFGGTVTDNTVLYILTPGESLRTQVTIVPLPQFPNIPDLVTVDVIVLFLRSPYKDETIF